MQAESTGENVLPFLGQERVPGWILHKDASQTVLTNGAVHPQIDSGRVRVLGCIVAERQQPTSGGDAKVHMPFGGGGGGQTRDGERKGGAPPSRHRHDVCVWVAAVHGGIQQHLLTLDLPSTFSIFSMVSGRPEAA